ncbi:MAG: sigma-70 family RNA polymerase sigma factor [Candidatus Methylacidiphilales bacterium]
MNPRPVNDVEPEDVGENPDRWVALAQAGDPEGWVHLHKLYYAGLWGTAYQIVRDEQMAEDVVQETFLKAFKQLRHFRGDSKFSTWIYRIAVNQAYDTVRKQKRRQKWLGLFPLKENEDDPEHETAVNETSATMLERADLRDAIDRAMATLPEEHRAVVHLRLVQGFSTEETARILKLKKGTVLSRLFYSCQKLKKLLKDAHETH